MKQSSAWLDRVTWIVGITTTLGMASQSGVSWIVDALIKSAGMSVQDASLMATVELVAMGATMLLLAPVIHRLPHKALVLTFILGLVALLACSVGGIVGLLLERSLKRGGSLASTHAIHAQ